MPHFLLYELSTSLLVYCSLIYLQLVHLTVSLVQRGQWVLQEQQECQGQLEFPAKSSQELLCHS